MNHEQRRLHIFNFLKRSGDSARSISEIFEYIKSRDIKIDRKTIARDMDYFQNDPTNGIITYGEKPIFFKLRPNATFVHNLKMDESTLETILMGLSILKTNSPSPIEKRAQNAIEKLLGMIDGEGSEIYSHFIKKHLFCNSKDGKSIISDETSFNLILMAVKENRIFRADYINSKNQSNQRILSPLLFYLVATTPFIYALDLSDMKRKVFKIARFSEVYITERPGLVIDTNELVSFEEKLKNSFGGFISDNSETLKIEIIGTDKIYQRFSEHVFHETQKITKEEDLYIISFEVPSCESAERFFLEEKNREGVLEVRANKSEINIQLPYALT